MSTQASLPSQPSSMGQLLAVYQIPVELHPAFQDYTPAEFGLVATSLERILIRFWQSWSTQLLRQSC